MRTSFLISYILCLQLTFSQSWQVVGDTMASDGCFMQPICLKFDKTNKLHLAYRSCSGQSWQQNWPVVRKFNGQQWDSAGLAVDTAWVMSMGLDFDNLNRPWLFYNNSYDSAKASVRYLSSNIWTLAGNSKFTGPASFNHIKIAPDNTPFIVFRDKNHNYSASVMNFNGIGWQYVGPPGFTPQTVSGGALYTRIEFDKTGKLFLVYCDFSYNSHVSVMSFNGSSWSFVGPQNISGVSAAYTSIVFDSQNRPVICYVGGSQSSIFIKRFNGSAWVDLSPVNGLAVGSFPDLAIDKQDNLYVVYTANDKPSVQKYSNGSWSLIGSALSPTIAMYTTIAVDTKGVPYICYQDFTDRYKNGWGPYHCATVLKYVSATVNSIEKNTAHPSSFCVYPNPSSALLRVSFENNKAQNVSLTVNSISGQRLYEKKFTGSFNTEINLASFPKGTYFISLVSGEVIETKKIVLE